MLPMCSCDAWQPCVLIGALWAQTLKHSHAGLYTHSHAPHDFIQIDSAAAPPCEVACQSTWCVRFKRIQDGFRANCSVR
eukprot:6074395-Alexandrium_andersonii.AAC.1